MMTRVGYILGRGAGWIVVRGRNVAGGFSDGYSHSLYGPPARLTGRIVLPQLCPNPAAHRNREAS